MGGLLDLALGCEEGEQPDKPNVYRVLVAGEELKTGQWITFIAPVDDIDAAKSAAAETFGAARVRDVLTVTDSGLIRKKRP